MGAASESQSTILRLHGKEEKIIEESGIPYTFLRPIAFMQNFVKQFGHTIRTQNAFYVPAGDAKLGFIDARDIAAVAVKMLTDSYEASHPDRIRHMMLLARRYYHIARLQKSFLMKLVRKYRT